MASRGTPSIGESAATGATLVFLAALCWSFGGTLARIAEVESPWVTIFWRTLTGSLFLLIFMLWRDGFRGTVRLFDEMGWPGLAIGLCFATASTSFVVALEFTTVANILLMGAGVPLIAALISWVLFRERVGFATWIAIVAVIGGVAVMVSDSLTGKVNPIGDGLALLIAFSFATATVITRRYAETRMTPAVFCGAAMGWLASVAVTHGLINASLAVPIRIDPMQLVILTAFGLTLGLGMAMFTTGARLIPSAFAALLGTAETILGPLWVWLFLDEVPSQRTLIGGGIILVSLVAYLAWQMIEHRKIKRIPPTIP